jgi:hypothetical protein
VGVRHYRCNVVLAHGDQMLQFHDFPWWQKRAGIVIPEIRMSHSRAVCAFNGAVFAAISFRVRGFSMNFSLPFFESFSFL